MAEQSFTVRIPVEIDTLGREALGQSIVDFIIDRTERGLDKNNQQFAQYSQTYKESDDFKIVKEGAKKVDLTLTGQMIGDLGILRHATGSITIGYLNGTNANQKAEWAISGAAKRPMRNFLGITDSDLAGLVATFDTRNATEEDSEVNRQARAIINRILGQFGG